MTVERFIPPDEKWTPIVNGDGVVVCDNCSQSWSNHTMDGQCAFTEDEENSDAR